MAGPLADALLEALGSWGEVEVDPGDVTRARAVVERDGLRWPLLAAADDPASRLVVFSIAPVTVPAERLDEAAAWTVAANLDLVLATWELRRADGGVRCRTSVDLEGVPADLTSDGRLVAHFAHDLLHQNVAVARRYLPGLLQLAEHGGDPEALVAATDAAR